MAKIRSHYVPQFYLKYFLVYDSKTFWVYDKKDFSVSSRTPLNTAVIGDFYLAETEGYLSKVENDAKSVFDKWISGRFELTKDDRVKVSHFLAFMYCRVPRTIEVGKEIGRIGLDYAYEKIKEIANDPLKLKENYKKFCDDSKNYNLSFDDFSKATKSISRDSHDINEKFVMARTLSLSPEIFTQLMQMNWNLYIAKKQYFFITNDTPLNVFIYEEEKKKAIFGGGFADPKVEVNFPVSPRMNLRLDRKGKGGISYVGEPFISERNRRIAIMAEQYIISPFQSNRIKKLLSEFSWTYKKAKLDRDIIYGKFKNNKKVVK